MNKALNYLIRLLDDIKELRKLRGVLSDTIVSGFTDYWIVRYRGRQYSYSDWVLYASREHSLNRYSALRLANVHYVLENCYMYLNSASYANYPWLHIGHYEPIVSESTGNIAFGLRSCSYDVNNCLVYHGDKLLKDKVTKAWALCHMDDITVIGTHVFSPIYANKQHKRDTK